MKVLIVEDERSLLELLALLIEELGYEVLTAGNGKEALQIIENEDPALVISDVMMPIMDGYSLVKQIRLRPDWGHIKVVLLSAANIDRHRPPPADAYAAKPYDLNDMEKLISRLTT